MKLNYRALKVHEGHKNGSKCYLVPALEQGWQGNLGEYVWYHMYYGQSCAVSLDPVSGRKEGEEGGVRGAE